MATLASLTVRLGMDTNPLARARQRASEHLRGLSRDADGRLRDMNGRFASEGDSMGTSLAQGIARSVRGGMSSIGGAISSAGPHVQMAAMALAGVFAVTLGPALITAIGGLGVIGLSAMLLKDKPAVRKAAKSLASTAKDTLTSAAKPMIKPLSEAMGDLEQTVRGLTPEFRDMFKTVADSGALKNLTSGIDKMLHGIMPGFNDMLDNMGPVFDALESMLENVGKGVGSFFSSMGKSAPEAAQALEDLGVLLRGILTWAGFYFGAMTKVYSVIRGFIVGIIDVFTWLYDVLVGHSIIPDLCNAIVRWFVGLPGRILGAIAGFVVDVISKFASLASGAIGKVRAGVAAIVGWFKSLPGRAAGALGSLASKVGGRMATASARLLSLAQRGVTRTVSFISGLPRKASGALGSLAGAVGGRMSDAGNRLVSVARSKVNSAKNVVASLPGKARNALGGVGSVLWNAGSSLISGFIDGIKSRIPSVEGVLGGLTSSLTSWKGPESLDKKILTPAGGYVMSGFVKGLESGIGSVRSTLQGVTADLPGMTASVDGVVSAAAVKPREDRIVFDMANASEEWKRVIRTMVKLDGGGDVQSAFGT